MNMDRFKRIVSTLPLHIVVIVMVAVWLVPTLGVFITSFRTREAVRESGWWAVFGRQRLPGQTEYERACASCHGSHGQTIPTADLSDPEVVADYLKANRLLPMLRKPIQGEPHIRDAEWQEMIQDTARTKEALDALSPISRYLETLSNAEVAGSRFTVSNWIDALVGYKGTTTYQEDCATGVSQSGKFACNASDLLNPEGMARAFLNSLLVTIPSTILPILFAAFAAYAFAWLDFKGRAWMFTALVGLQIVPLQMTLVPIAKLYSQLGLQSSFLGIWLFHTGFGLPYAIYLLRNFLGGLPQDLFESIYLDGANHWIAFWKLALPLSVPAVASLAIFQFLWVWNDLLVAIILLPGNPVLTYQITNLIDPKGGNWHLLTAAAFLSMIVPMIVFLAFQRYFVRGLLAGAVKG
ncbi:MAG: carbohydrate ABC transporter permease [Anaerolineae bacterium]